MNYFWPSTDIIACYVISYIIAFLGCIYFKLFQGPKRTRYLDLGDLGLFAIIALFGPVVILSFLIIGLTDLLKNRVPWSAVIIDGRGK